MKLIFESLNDNRVKAEVCTETAILNCVGDIKKVIKESTDASDNETKKGIGTKTLDILKLGYKKAVEFIVKILTTLNEFRKKAWVSIKAAASKARGKNANVDTKSNDSNKPQNGQLALGHKQYEVYDCLNPNHVSVFINKIINDEVITNVTDVTERNKKVDEVFFSCMFGAKNVTTYTELPKVEVGLDKIDKALDNLEKQANDLVKIIKNKEKELNNPRLKDELVKSVASETLIVANRAAANIGNMIAHLLSALNKK